MSGTATWSPDGNDVTVARPVVEFVRAVNAGDMDTAIAQLAPDAVHHTRVSDYQRDGVRTVFSMLHRVFPDLHLDIRAQDVQGARVVSSVVATGTHRGSCLGRPPTGGRVVWESVDVADVETGGTGRSDHHRVVKRYWDLWNDPELYRWLGFIPGARR